MNSLLNIALLFSASWAVVGATMRGARNVIKPINSPDHVKSDVGHRALRMAKRMTKDEDNDDKMVVTLTVTNLSFEQPFSGFFVMVHNDDAAPLYIAGTAATPQLASLAEDGTPAGLVALYQNAPGVKSATAFMDGAPFMGGNVFDIVVEVCEEYPLVTIASMAINTNDCFVAMNGVAVFPGMVGLFDGLDAGSEENNEDCASIPGPACAMNTGNVRSGNGEGFVHVHRGMHDLNPETIPAVEYDWRNPMMRVDVSSMM